VDGAQSRRRHEEIHYSGSRAHNAVTTDVMDGIAPLKEKNGN
jgi:hypothetical protein